jgi:hypothetical protein
MGEHALKLHVRHVCLESGSILRAGFERVIVQFGFGELEKRRRFAQRGGGRIQPIYDRLDLLFLFAEFLGAPAVGPDVRFLELLPEDGKARSLRVIVKDTSADRRRAPARPATASLSR